MALAMLGGDTSFTRGKETGVTRGGDTWGGKTSERPCLMWNVGQRTNHIKIRNIVKASKCSERY